MCTWDQIPHGCELPGYVLGTKLRVEEMAEQLRAFDVLLEDPGSSPSTHLSTHQLPIIPVPGDPVPSSDSTGTKHTCGINTYM